MSLVCFGEYNHSTLTCNECPHRLECAKEQVKLLKRQKSIRYGGKYKGRGKEKKRSII